MSAALLGAGRAAPLIGWDILALVFCGWVWSTVWRLGAEATASHAKRENPGRDLADLVLLGAAIASLIAVGVVLFGAGSASGNLKYMEAGLALASVFVSWTLVHTVFTLKYARLYYSGQAGGIDRPSPRRFGAAMIAATADAAQPSAMLAARKADPGDRRAKRLPSTV